MPVSLRLFVPLSLVAALAPGAAASEIAVRPGQRIQAALEKARPGDTIRVGAGTYSEAPLNLPSGITLVSADGPGRARLDGGSAGAALAIYGRRNIVVDGFEIVHSGINLVKIQESSDVTVRNCKIHDAGDGDCIKATIDCHRIIVEDCEIYNPGSGSWEQNIDFINTEGGIVRRCLLYHVNGHGHQIGFFKGEAGCIFEQNVVLNASDGTDDSPPAWALGQETDSEYKHGDYECVDSIVRDNVFINCRRGAIGFYGCKGGYAYGNVLINSGPAFTFHHAGNSVRPAVDHLFVFNNAVLNPAGNLREFYQGRDKLDGKLVHDHNLVWNGGKRLPGDFKETHACMTAPPVPAGDPLPSEGYAALIARYARLAPKEGDLVALLPPVAQPPVKLAAAPPSLPAPPDPGPPVTTRAASRPGRVSAPDLVEEEFTESPEAVAREAEAPPSLRPKQALPSRGPVARAVPNRRPPRAVSLRARHSPRGVKPGSRVRRKGPRT